jgi:hypothetical protein
MGATNSIFKAIQKSVYTPQEAMENIIVTSTNVVFLVQLFLAPVLL